MDAHTEYLLHLADNALVLGQRNAEWCGHGPVLEEDIAMANISLDLIGQARLLYQYAATRIGGDCDENRLAYFRDAPQFRNLTLLELPHSPGLMPGGVGERDYGVTIARNFLYSALMGPLWNALCASSDSTLAGIAAKSLKETQYHLRHSHDWLVRFGDGTEESHRRAQSALDYLFPFTQEFWVEVPFEAQARQSGITIELISLQATWDAQVDDTLTQAHLRRPPSDGHVSTGKQGVHSEHLSYLLGEMQSLARAHPGATW
ncbi:MAG: phenylacetate-CoA oxygenase subunit PaaC [Alphaproteobacteria bacterium]|nr:phenylacetate-CoA oxygenase subunit PaaC [Alphaproteobacteria bacterium]